MIQLSVIGECNTRNQTQQHKDKKTVCISHELNCAWAENNTPIYSINQDVFYVSVFV